MSGRLGSGERVPVLGTLKITRCGRVGLGKLQFPESPTGTVPNQKQLQFPESLELACIPTTCLCQILCEIVPCLARCIPKRSAP